MRFTKKLLTAMLVSILVLTLIPAVVFANDNISVTIDGQAVVFVDQGPIIVDGRTLVPVGRVFSALDFVPSWDGATQTATLTRDDFIVVITIGSAAFTTNGVSYTLDVPAQLFNGRTMLPIRAVLESVGYELNWSSATRTVAITTSTVPTDVPTEITEVPTAPTASVEFTRDDFLGHFDMDSIRAILDTDFTIGELNTQVFGGLNRVEWVILRTEMMPNPVTVWSHMRPDTEFVEWISEYGHLLDRNGYLAINRTIDLETGEVIYEPLPEGDRVHWLNLPHTQDSNRYGTQTSDVVLRIFFDSRGNVHDMTVSIDIGNSIELHTAAGNDIPYQVGINRHYRITEDFRAYGIFYAPRSQS